MPAPSGPRTAEDAEFAACVTSSIFGAWQGARAMTHEGTVVVATARYVLLPLAQRNHRIFGEGDGA